jgi:hypothetical protein
VALYGLRGKEYRYKSLSPSNPNNPINPDSDIILIQAFFINTIITCEEAVQFLPKILAIKA